jgi:hypothetical protein
MFHCTHKRRQRRKNHGATDADAISGRSAKRVRAAPSRTGSGHITKPTETERQSDSRKDFRTPTAPLLSSARRISKLPRGHWGWM